MVNEALHEHAAIVSGRGNPNRSRCRLKKCAKESGHYPIQEIAEAENINPSYVSRLLRMTLLAPEIVEAILAGRKPEGLTMAKAMRPFPLEWRRQIFM